MLKHLLCFVCGLGMLLLHAQTQFLSDSAEISILTIDPGTNLNDAFGHSAFRVKDDNLELDVVFNYGVYDFDTPNFYLKFARGKLNYRIAANHFEDFFNSYKAQQRSITEQILNLSLFEKQRLYTALLDNYKPKNQYYLYDFFYNNCATKIRDVLNTTLNNSINFESPEQLKPSTFRTLIQEKLNTNSWGSLGIDIALGSVIDQKATPEEHMFLPQFIHDFFAVASINANGLVKKEHILYVGPDNKVSSNFITSPWLILSLLAGLILWVTYTDKKNQKRSKWLDVVLFALTGLIGIFLLLLWFATDHSATANNYNLLWAFALNLVVIGQLRRVQPSAWFLKYLKFLVIMLCLMGLHWIIGVQVFAITLLPLVIALVLRYVYLIYFFSSSKS